MARMFVNYFAVLIYLCNVICTFGLKLYDSKHGSITHFKSDEIDILHIKCATTDRSLTDVFPRMNASITTRGVLIFRCPLPPKPLISVFETLNINTRAIDSVRLFITNSSYELPAANYTEGLDIRNMLISSESPSLFRHNKDFFTPLLNLTTLNLQGKGLEVISLPLHLEDLSLRGVELKYWGSCQFLKNLTIKGISELPTTWPDTCKELRKVHIEDSFLDTVQQLISVNHESLRFLTIRNTSLSVMSPELINATRNLRYLDLGNNKLSDDVCLKLPILPHLTSLRLQNNAFTTSCLKDLVPKLPALRSLKLNGNNFARTFSPNVKGVLGSLPFLEELFLENMAMKPSCLENSHFTSLKYLSLASDEPVQQLRLNDLPSTDAPVLRLDLRKRKILKTINDQTKDSWFKNQKTKLIILATEVECDCQNSELVYAIKENPQQFAIPSAKCSNTGREILEEPLENLECVWVSLGDCSARHRHKENPWTRLDCAELNLKDLRWKELLHDYPNPVQLNASGNYLTSLKDANLPDSIEWIDLRNNHFSRLDGNETAQLFSTSTRKVWLAGNSFVCDCANKAMLDQLYKHRDQIMDYESLLCVDSGLSLYSRTASVCSVGKDAVWTTCCVMAFLIVFSMVVLRRFSREMKLILYAHGYCGSCVTEEDLDSDRPYDAFVSFAHADQSFVTDVLIPKLEAMSDSFRVCVHYRDWVVGDWIPSQIMRSVRLSKRTIIVLSKNFVNSSWGTLEFRYAQASATFEGRSRLLVIVTDDVLDMKLEPELQGYLAYNTFLHCDDPWFWEKLRYAMPRKDGSIIISTQPKNIKHALDLSSISIDNGPTLVVDKKNNCEVKEHYY